MQRVVVAVLVLLLAACSGSTGSDEVAHPPIGAGTLAFDGVLEPDTPWDMPYGVDVDAEGRTFVFDAGNNRVVAFDAEGLQIAEWGTGGSEDGAFDSLGFGGLAVDDDGIVWVVDNGNRRLQGFRADGQHVRTIGAPDAETMVRPIGLAAHDGRLHVTDDETGWVDVFDADDGTHVRRYGGPGEADGNLQHPTGIDVNGQGSWVAEYDGERVQRFDEDGTVVGMWRLAGPAGTYAVPEGLTVDGDGTVLVTGYRAGAVWALPAEGHPDPAWVEVLSEELPPEARLRTPVDLAVAPDGTVVVVDQRGAVVRYTRA
jgi:DNA-binding beta-propeller fold protein YncE